MKSSVITIFSFMLLLSCSTQKVNQIKTTSINKSISEVMNKQQQDWNKGDIDAFMEGYWKSDSLRFVSNFKVTYGWQETLENYKRGYPNQAAMGKLRFDILETDILSDRAAIVLGRFTLDYPDSSVTGLFTLTWKKIQGNWKIISDMTCG